MSQGLKNKFLTSFIWVAIEKAGQKFLQFGISIVLARLLLPEEFGVVGLVSVFIGLSVVLVDSGFSFNLIRKDNVAKVEYNVVFWFNFLVSFLAFWVLYFLSPFLANFFNEPLLIDVVKILGINIIINALGSIQSVKLVRDLKFKELSIIGLTSKLISGTLAIYLAYNGFGVWSLVFQELLNNIIRNILMFYYNRFIPTLNFSMKTFRELFNFSSKLLYGSISYAIVGNISSLIIGKFYNISDVGYFGRASRLQKLPVTFFMEIIQKVTLPTFAKIQNQEDRFKNNYKKSIRISFYLILFPMGLLFITAYPLIEFIYTSKWLPAAPMVQILTISGIFYPLNALNVNIIGIKGHADYVMYSQFLKDGLKLIGLGIGMWFGILGLIWSLTITSFLAYFINVYYVNKVIKLTIKEQLICIWPSLKIGIISFGLVFICTQFIILDYKLLLLFEIISFSILYFGLSIFLKNQEYIALVNLIFDRYRHGK